jgi:hypothetical protein
VLFRRRVTGVVVDAFDAPLAFKDVSPSRGFRKAKRSIEPDGDVDIGRIQLDVEPIDSA